VFLPTPPTNGFLHPIIFGKDHFTPFKNEFQIIFFGIFLEHTFRKKFYEFQINHWKLKKCVPKNIFCNYFLTSRFPILKNTLFTETPIPKTAFAYIISIPESPKIIKNNSGISKNVGV